MKRPAVDFPFHSDEGCALGRIHWSGPFVRSPGVKYGAIDHLIFVYVTRGVCIFQDAESNFHRLTPGDMMVLLPMVKHGYGAPPGEEWDERYIACDGALVEMWKERGLVSASDWLWRLLPVDYWVNRMIDVIGDVADPDPDESLAQLGRLQVLIADMRLARRSTASYPDDRIWLNQARKLLEASENQNRPDLDAAADAMGCGYHTFRRRFTHLCGISPARYRLQSQVNMARGLMMRHPTMSSKEIGVRCGFADEYHFSKQFKNISGMSPSDYRGRSGRPREEGRASESE